MRMSQYSSYKGFKAKRTGLAAPLGEDSVVHQLECHEMLQTLLPHSGLGQRLLLGGESDACDSAAVFLSSSDADATPTEADVQQGM